MVFSRSQDIAAAVKKYKNAGIENNIQNNVSGKNTAVSSSLWEKKKIKVICIYKIF